jgi:hypothetical protein
MDRRYAQLSDATLPPPATSYGDGVGVPTEGPPTSVSPPFSAFATVIDRQLFSAVMLEDLRRELPWPPYGFL